MRDYANGRRELLHCSRGGSIPSSRTRFMTQLSFNFPKNEPTEGMILDPQPPMYSDCWETYCSEKPGQFDFYKGSDMEGHYIVHTVKTKNLNIEPQFDDNKRLWIWKKVSEETVYTRNWYKERGW